MNHPKDNFRLFGVMVWMICSIFFLYEFFLRTVIGTFQMSIMYDLNISALKFSILSTTSYMLVYGLMQIPVSLIVDRYGLKTSLITGSLACTLSCIGLACSTSFYSAIASRMLMGFGSSFGYICLLVAIYDWMPKKYNALIIGISQVTATIGPIIAAGPLVALIDTFNLSWQMLFWSMAFLGFCIAFFVLIFVENNREHKDSYTILRRPEAVFVSLKRLFSSSQAWTIAIFCATIYFSIEYLSENEGISFVAAKGFDPAFSSSMISLIWLGFAIGSPAAGLISDLLERRKTVLSALAFCCVVSTTAIVYSNNGKVLTVAFFFLGFAASAQGLGFAVISDHFKKNFIALGYGLNNALVTSIVAINAPIISFILEKIKADEHPTATEYSYAFTSLIFLTMISLILAVFFIKETFGKSMVEFTVLQVKKKNS